MSDSLAEPKVARAACCVLAVALALGCGESPSPARLAEARARHVLIVGLDGATWDVIAPMLEAGRLPVLTGLLRSGVRATLQAEEGRARSGPSWTTIASGKLSGRHGVTGNDGQVEVARFWDILGGAGLRSAIVGWILTYPVRPLPGLMLSGPFGRPQSFPDPLLAELEARLGPYEPDAELRGVSDSFVASVHESTRQQARYVREALAREDWSAVAVVFTAPDRLQHFYWRYREPERFGLDPADPHVRARARVIDAWYEAFDPRWARSSPAWISSGRRSSS